MDFPQGFDVLGHKVLAGRSLGGFVVGEGGIPEAETFVVFGRQDHVFMPASLAARAHSRGS